MHHMYHVCKQNIGKYVSVQTNMNEQIEGYVEHVDENNVYMMVPEYNENDIIPAEMGPGMPGAMPENYGYGNPGGCGCHPRVDRQFYGGYGFGYPGYYPGFGFRRLVLPLAALVALSTLPYFY